VIPIALPLWQAPVFGREQRKGDKAALAKPSDFPAKARDEESAGIEIAMGVALS